MGGLMEHQAPWVYRYRKWYLALFERPHILIRPAFRSFAFTNPTIRIFRISADMDKDVLLTGVLTRQAAGRKR
jgi:hypothetical protein